MNIKRLRNTLLTGTVLLLSTITPVQAATTADILFVVDESGSMSGEHSWISTMVTTLDAELNTAGVTGNQFGLVGFGGSKSGNHYKGHAHGGFGTAANLAAQTSSLVTHGIKEDGYSGIDFALNNFTFRNNAALNVILITDEDRDDEVSSLNYSNILAALTGRKALLNAVVNAEFSDSVAGSGALGIDSGLNSYFADGLGSFNTFTNGSNPYGVGSTEHDYVDLALATGGAAWDLNKLRAGGLLSDSFTKAFINIKVAEITKQLGPSAVPIPAAAFMFSPALLGFLGLRRKAKITTV